jgi:hypothetical protein
MRKRPRNTEKCNSINTKEKIIENIKKNLITQREIYDKYISNSSEHNLVIEKVNERFITNTILPQDINHFKEILRNRYHDSISLLHDCSDNIRKLQKEHVQLIDDINNLN